MIFCVGHLYNIRVIIVTVICFYRHAQTRGKLYSVSKLSFNLQSRIYWPDTILATPHYNTPAPCFFRKKCVFCNFNLLTTVYGRRLTFCNIPKWCNLMFWKHNIGTYSFELCYDKVHTPIFLQTISHCLACR